jgi:hypothetical protein
VFVTLDKDLEGATYISCIESPWNSFRSEHGTRATSSRKSVHFVDYQNGRKSDDGDKVRDIYGVLDNWTFHKSFGRQCTGESVQWSDDSGSIPSELWRSGLTTPPIALAATPIRKKENQEKDQTENKMVDDEDKLEHRFLDVSFVSIALPSPRTSTSSDIIESEEESEGLEGISWGVREISVEEESGIGKSGVSGSEALMKESSDGKWTGSDRDGDGVRSESGADGIGVRSELGAESSLNMEAGSNSEKEPTNNQFKYECDNPALDLTSEAQIEESTHL